MMDRYSRGSAPIVSEILGVPVVVHNVPGATGWNRVFRSAPDGHTLGVGEPVSQLGLQLVQELPYKPIGEDGLTWLGRFSTGNQLIQLSKSGSAVNPIPDRRVVSLSGSTLTEQIYPLAHRQLPALLVAPLRLLPAAAPRLGLNLAVGRGVEVAADQ
jgi:hypothetical protein